jgi:diaminohydroxyphosphoribosylaminopyrimidine deaminase / 5-amino-6-(5-phosphoribosylamino)uracil reductase
MQVTLKLATSLDGGIALADGQSKWITGPQSRAEVHRLRAAHQAVLTGIGTVLADDPELTARTDPPAPAQPLRVVLDTRARLPVDCRLVRTARAFGRPLVLVGQGVAGSVDAARLLELDVDVREVAVTGGRIDPSAALAELSRRHGIASVMVEAGSGVAGAMLAAGLVDTIEWFRAPVILGGDSRPAIGPQGVETFAVARRWERVGVRPCGADLWETYRRA